MLHCGGRVVDEAGKPIAGARVHLSFDMPGWMSMWIREAMTDEQGSWHRALPPECMDLSVKFEHPEYYLDESDGRPPRNELIAGTHTVTMKRGLLLEGKITDERGEPVENVLVCGSRPSSFSPSPYNQIIEDSGMARTVRDGTFCVHGMPPGARIVSVYPDHYAPVAQTVDIREGMDPVNVTLKAGRTYRARVVDAHGNPMEGVRVGTQEWRSGKEQRWMSRLAATDAQGMLALTNLPEGQIELYFGKKPYLGFHHDVPADISQVDKVVMYDVPVFTGNVVDADAGQPVTEFEIVSGIRREEDASISWSRHYRKQVNDSTGAFRSEWNGFGISYPVSAAACIKVEAKGYVSSAPILLEFGKTCEPVTIRMNKGTTIAGTVVGPDGSAAAKAQVALVRKGELAFIDRDQFSATGFVRQAEIVTTADAQGRFELPPAGEPGLVVAVHRTGYTQVESTQFTAGSSLRLTAWSRVEGSLDRSRIADKEVAIVLSPAKEPDKQTPGFDWLFSSVTPTSDTFVFDCVPSVPLVVGRMSRYELHNGEYFVPEPGKTHKVHIGEHGRAVTGRIVPPQGKSVPFADPRCVHAVAFRTDSAGVPAEMAATGEQSFNWLWQGREDVYKPSTTLQKRFVPAIAEDGSFTFGGLEPGTYEFVINAHAPLGENVSCGRGVLEAVGVSQFTVPDGKAASAVIVPDVGLRLLTYPKVGESAPLFEAKTFDGRTIKLADLRGKVVLLDFWATWCNPCVAQLPQVQQIHEAFGANDKFAMIGMSLDWDIERAKGFLRQKPLKWPQVSLGNMETSPVVRQYGVGGVPMTILIDPDGKILAMDVPIDQLQEQIRAALAVR
jgi:peroxiredoxin